MSYAPGSCYAVVLPRGWLRWVNSKGRLKMCTEYSLRVCEECGDYAATFRGLCNHCADRPYHVRKAPESATQERTGQWWKSRA